MAALALLSQLFITCALLLPLGSAAHAASVWKVSKQGQQFYLGGTVHILARSDYPLPVAFQRAFDLADEVWFEADLDAFGQALQQPDNRAKVLYRPPLSLAQALKPETYRALVNYCRQHAIAVEQLTPLKPAFASTSLLVLRLAQLGVDSPGVDAHFFQQSKTARKRRAYFETSSQQLGFLSQLEQGSGGGDALILQTLSDLGLLEQSMNQLRQAWRQGDLVELERLQLKPLQQFYPRIYRYLIKERNEAWMRDIESFVSKPGVELALVGVLHMLGEDGLLALLKAKGYKIQQLE